jgi:aspartyl-tRNA(Asn)/glutamyl-tRNA(Gln) amidotransferase subunit B
MSELISLIESGTLTRAAAKTVFEQMYRTGRPPAAIVAELGLAQSGDDDELDDIVARAIAANPKPVADFRGGKAAALQALIGAVMRETKGRYHADRVREALGRGLRTED